MGAMSLIERFDDDLRACRNQTEHHSPWKRFSILHLKKLRKNWIGLGLIVIDFPYISEELTDKCNSEHQLLLVSVKVNDYQSIFSKHSIQLIKIRYQFSEIAWRQISESFRVKNQMNRH
jgi:hypothetical protein